MLNHYQYFIVLAEEQNISKAAERLFISHQCLSQYVKSLESEYGITFFTRRPFALTEAGKLMLESLRKIELIDLDFQRRLLDLNSGKTGELKIGTTEGRLRLLMPDMMQQFKEAYPRVNLRMYSSPTSELLDMLFKNKLDFIIIGNLAAPSPLLHHQDVTEENLYLVISDNMLREYFPDTWPQCKDTFQHGADLGLFQHVPFILNHPNYSARGILDRHLLRINASLRCINEITAMDLHHRMSANDYAASFALAMYLPEIWRMNASSPDGSQLNIFPIAGLTETNTITIAYQRDKIFPEYTKSAMQMVKRLCRQYCSFDMQPPSSPRGQTKISCPPASPGF